MNIPYYLAHANLEKSPWCQICFRASIALSEWLKLHRVYNFEETGSKTVALSSDPVEQKTGYQ